MAWRVRTLNATVDEELDALPADMRARFVRIAGLIAAVGLERVGIARALYVTATERQVVVVRALVKKTRHTPRREIELALQRAGEVSQ